MANKKPNSRDLDVEMAEARAAATANGACFDGNSKSGTFSGKGVSGSYKVKGKQVEITIHEKPFFATWGLIEGKIGSFFS